MQVGVGGDSVKAASEPFLDEEIDHVPETTRDVECEEGFEEEM